MIFAGNKYRCEAFSELQNARFATTSLSNIIPAQCDSSRYLSIIMSTSVLNTVAFERLRSTFEALQFLQWWRGRLPTPEHHDKMPGSQDIVVA